MKLAVFDVDGTLVDSQAQIHSAMTAAMGEIGRPLPDIAAVRAVVGLSLPRAIATICPDLSQGDVARAVDAYRAAWTGPRPGSAAPMFEGARDCLSRLSRHPDLLLGLATGKGRAGLDSVLERHGLAGFFVAVECADHNPSKPDPAMLNAVCARAGVAAADTVMIGDTSFDVEMALAAAATPIGVAWGYHAPAALHAAGADWIAGDFPALADHIARWAAT